eukprot:jgi/Botrbrau1/5693/Bobra.0071s0027.1
MPVNPLKKVLAKKDLPFELLATKKQDFRTELPQSPALPLTTPVPAVPTQVSGAPVTTGTTQVSGAPVTPATPAAPSIPVTPAIPIATEPAIEKMLKSPLSLLKKKQEPVLIPSNTFAPATIPVTSTHFPHRSLWDPRHTCTPRDTFRNAQKLILRLFRPWSS